MVFCQQFMSCRACATVMFVHFFVKDLKDVLLNNDIVMKLESACKFEVFVAEQS